MNLTRFTTPTTGADSRRVQRRRNNAAEIEALAEVAESVYHSRKTPAYRALALRTIRKWSVVTGALLMLGLGAWSAVGVHHGVAGTAPPWSADWVLGWVLEPVLLAGVALIVIVRSALAMAGARLSGWVWLIEVGLLSLSLAANVHALPVSPSGADVVMRLTGPIGCLLVSMVLVLVDRAIDRADIEVESETGQRWHAVRSRLADSATGVAERAADTLATRLNGQAADSAPSAPDNPTGRTLSGVVTSTDTTADTRADSIIYPSGQRPDIPADDTPDSGPDTPADSADNQAERTVFEQAMDTARTLGADTIDTLSVRALAARLECGRTTAAQVRNAFLESSAGADEASLNADTA